MDSPNPQNVLEISFHWDQNSRRKSATVYFQLSTVIIGDIVVDDVVTIRLVKVANLILYHFLESDVFWVRVCFNLTATMRLRKGMIV